MAVCIFAFVTVPIWAHQYVLHPVDIEIKVEPRQIRARIESSAPYWMYEIMHVLMTFPMPATQWPEPYQESARGYVERCFQLRMDGRPLAAASFDCRYVQEPLSPGSSRVVFDLVYAIPSIGERLSGRARFFAEAYEEHLKETSPDAVESKFLTRLKISGAKKVALELPIEKPDFDVSLNGMVMTKGQKRTERFNQYAMRVLSSPFFWIALIVLAVQLYKRLFKRSEE